MINIGNLLIFQVCEIVVRYSILGSHITMDKSWMNDRNKFPQPYIQFAKENGNFQEGGLIPCPCNFCNNTIYKSYTEVKQHIHCRGFNKSYTEWVYHGEKLVFSDSDAENAKLTDSINCVEMLNDIYIRVWKISFISGH